MRSTEVLNVEKPDPYELFIFAQKFAAEIDEVCASTSSPVDLANEAFRLLTLAGIYPLVAADVDVWLALKAALAGGEVLARSGQLSRDNELFGGFRAAIIAAGAI